MTVENIKVGSLVRFADQDLGIVYEVDPRGVYIVEDFDVKIEKINCRIYWLEDGFVSQFWWETHEVAESYTTHDLEVLN